MIGPEKPGLPRRPALIAAVLLGSIAIGGLGWSLGRASAERTPVAGAPAPVAAGSRPPAVIPTQPAASPPGAVVRSTAPLIRPAPPEPEKPAETLLAAAGATPGQAAEPAAEAPRGPGAARPARINLNTATSAELELLPGIGPGLAQRIIDHRTRAGRFRTVAELDKVKGIGPRTIDKLRPLVSVE